MHVVQSVLVVLVSRTWIHNLSRLSLHQVVLVVVLALVSTTVQKLQCLTSLRVIFQKNSMGLRTPILQCFIRRPLRGHLGLRHINRVLIICSGKQYLDSLQVQ